MGLSRDGALYLGRIFDLAQGKLLDEPLTYDPADLTTHAIVTGMTGSGKTGLCVAMLEEAAIEGIPAIIIDPKGDLTNLLLHFPEMRPEDLGPWIDPDTARREGKELDQAAAETAETWRKGQASWGLGADDIRLLKESVRFGLFTPGSTAGTPVNVLSSFASPGLPWDEHRETLREKISTIVTALLGLIGISDIDPLRSREHILLSQILEHAWSRQESLTLIELILQTQNPPFENLGAFPVNRFFPEKDRFDLAMRLNSFLASPSFEVWREGLSLDVGNLLYGPAGKPRHNIFYLAHLSDNERMFFVTLLFAALESWMRTQRGTSNLRLLVYFDEIVGYLPPVANPPSRPILLRMLKQARAFGVGLLLATQNPIDVDYRGLSNAGTWIIGRLQTDQDKQRLLDGLESAGSGLERKQVDRIISALPKRTFYLHNVHARAPRIFQTRWVLNYLAGPLMRTQIPALLKLDGIEPLHPAGEASREPSPSTPREAAAAAAQAGSPLSVTRPAAPAGLEEYIIPSDLSLDQSLRAAGLGVSAQVETGPVIYRPGLYVQAEVAYSAKKYGITFGRKLASLPVETRGRGVIWDDFVWTAYDGSQLHRPALPGARFASLPGWLADARQLSALKTDFSEWVYRTSAVEIYTNEALKIAAGPDTSEEEFIALARRAADEAKSAETARADPAYTKKREDLTRRIRLQEMQVDSHKSTVGQRRLEEVGKAGEVLLGVLQGRKRSISSNLTKRRLSAQAQQNLERERTELEMLKRQLEELESQHKTRLQDIDQRWSTVAAQITRVAVTPYKKDIFVTLFGVAWLPYYSVTVNGQPRELAAYSAS